MVDKLSFSVGLFDDDGDCFDSGIFIHCSNRSIALRFQDVAHLESFAAEINSMMPEVKETVDSLSNRLY
jgi:hypothetical protein